MEPSIYEVGVYISLINWVFQSIWLIIVINSKLEKNLNKVNQRLSWLTYLPKPIESRDEIHPPLYKKILKYLAICSIGLIAVFLSWLNLFYLFVNYIFNRYKRDGEPEVLKNFRWKIRNLDMSYEQILQELHKVEFNDISYKEFKKNYEDRVKIILGED